MSNKKLLFIGAGAIGSYIGAFLCRAGHRVTLVDPWPEQVEAIKSNGVDVTGPHEPFNARATALHVHEAQLLDSDFDIAFVAMKSQDTRWAAYFARRFLAPHGYVVSAQNCWNDPVVASIVGRERAVGLVMSRISVAVWEPGRVERGAGRGRDTGYNVFRVGEHDGAITPRAQELAEILRAVDAAVVTDNLWGERWAKLCQNSMGNPVQGLSGLGGAGVCSLPRGRLLTIALARESARVGLALGYRVPGFGGAAAEKWAATDRGDAFEEMDAMLTPAASSGGGWRSSMAQDVVKKRRSEIEYMNGHVVAEGRRTGVPTPVSAAVVEAMREIDSGKLAPGPANIERVLSAAGV